MINLGCEMVYILHQRLNAQGIPAEKSVKVLQDIIKTMLEPGFLADKLFVAQDMYSLASTRKVFDKIAHSSIMKLSENRWGVINQQAEACACWQTAAAHRCQPAALLLAAPPAAWTSCLT